MTYINISNINKRPSNNIVLVLNTLSTKKSTLVQIVSSSCYTKTAKTTITINNAKR